MIFDATNLFSDAQAITASAASTNYIDLGAAGTTEGGTAIVRDIGPGNEIEILVQVTTVFDSSADDETLTVAIQMDSTTTFTPDKTIQLEVISNANLKTLGYRVPIRVVPDGVNLRYIRLYYTVTGSGNFTAGKITAGIVAGVQTNTVY